MVKQYRKKPVVVDAMQWTGSGKCWLKMVEFIGRNLIDRPSYDILKISTLEGDLFASKNDFIIKGIHGEFYPCKPNIFEKTYELVGNA